MCGDYDHLLESTLEEADWIVESVSENRAIKQRMYEKIDQYKRPDAIVSSTTSSLPLTILSKERSENFKRNFLATHFYNPPARMLACEVATQSDTDAHVFGFMKDFLEHELRRVVIPVRNIAGFAGNRIAFLLFNRIAALAEGYGVEMMDYLIGPYTGRLMPPLATLDLVGVDIYKAIIENLCEYTNDEMHNSLILPDYINKMIHSGALGNKTPDNGGFYKKDTSGNCLYLNPATLDYVPAQKPHIEFVEAAEDMIHWGKYREAFDIIKTSCSKEADIVMDILCTYIAYSYSRIGEVTEREFGINGIDRVMSFGFNWAAPSVIVKMLGGKESVIELLHKKGLEVPRSLETEGESSLQVLNSGKYFVAR
ncbi:putative 3-hydroxyacyl-CoA dehydrogenase [subsurface metagenome]